VGIAVALAYIAVSSRVTTDWIELSKPHDGKGITYSTEAIFKSDIRLPDVKHFGGKAKFVPNPSSGAYSLGYLIDVSITSLDLDKVPKKYLKDKPEVIDGVSTMRLGIEQVHYVIRLRFTLRDKDGFTLLEVQSDAHTIESGKSNELQNLAKPQVPSEVAANVASILVQLGVEKCVTCQGE
jgi:hypothetical protein